MSDENVTAITIIFTGYIDDESIVVAVPGTHDLSDPTFNPLNHERVPLRMSDSGLMSRITDEEQRDAILEFLTHYYYMIHGTVVTSGEQIIYHAHHHLLDIPGHGIVTITPIGIINDLDPDTAWENWYRIAIANPSPLVHLLILLEIVDYSNLEYRAVDVNDTDRVQSIINAFLVLMGAYDFTPDDELDDESP